jgi:hypothetical protein
MSKLGLIESLTQVIPEHLHAEVAQELARGWRLEEVRAKHAAAQSAKLNRSLEHREVKGLGRLVARIPAQSFAYWNNRKGMQGCWNDKQFFKEFLRDNPECAVTNQHKNTVVNGAKGLFDSSGKKIT